MFPEEIPFFDPLNTGTQKITINRSIYDTNTGNSTANPREQFSLVSSFLDGSMVYGTDNATVTALRTFTAGLLKTTTLNGLELPPLVPSGVPVENNARIYNDSALYLLGDVRGNENPALTTLHTIFLREHNRRARELAVLNPTWTDEDLYQEARRWVIAHIQHVTFDEYLPITFGDGVDDYGGYNDTLNPTIYTEFSTGVFRYGHSEVEENIWRFNANGTVIPEGNLRLRNSYYNSPVTIGQVGIEPIIRGMAGVVQNSVDIYFVDDLRNYLFGQPGQGGFDLAAINIQRGRDHGLPSFNDLRRLYGFEPYANWSDINPDPDVYLKLAAAYRSIEDCDIYTCGLAETKDLLANVGFTYAPIILDQYTRIRDGDRFWYENGQWDAATLKQIQSSLLSDIILRNTPIAAPELQCAVFAVADGCRKTIPAVPPGPTYLKYDYTVTLVKKTAAHPYFGRGHAYGFAINGVEGATFNLVRGKTYSVKVLSSCAHAFVFLVEPDNNGTVLGPDLPVGPDGDPAYIGAVPNHGCISQNSEITLSIGYDAPDYFYYQCDFHNMLMGGNVLITGKAPTPTPPAINGASSYYVPIAFLLALVSLMCL